MALISTDKVPVLFRLDPVQYSKIEQALPAPVVGPNTTELQAGFALGVQHVLRILRDGYVSGA